MRWRLIGPTAVAVILFCGSGPTMLKVRPALRRHGPIKIQRQRDNGQWESTNWSGYAITAPNGNSLPNGSVTDVKGSWRVPNVTCSDSPLATPRGYAAFWVGIDGWISNTVEQIGTDSDCVNLAGTETATPTYYAWFEFYPQNGFVVGDYTKAGKCKSDCVEPGDLMAAEVQADAKNSFTVTITDLTQGWSFSTTSSVPGAQQSSAQWIAETPCCKKNGDLYHLANFGFADYGLGFTNVLTTSYATVKGATGSIGSFGNHVQTVTMVSEGDKKGSPAGTVMALPSILFDLGTSFSVGWQNSGP